MLRMCRLVHSLVSSDNQRLLWSVIPESTLILLAQPTFTAKSMASYSATRGHRPRFTVPADSITLAESFNIGPRSGVVGPGTIPSPSSS